MDKSILKQVAQQVLDSYKGGHKITESVYKWAMDQTNMDNITLGHCGWWIFKRHIWSKWTSKYPTIGHESSFYKRYCFRCGLAEEMWVH